jgi:signal transduction histidine kinase
MNIRSRITVIFFLIVIVVLTAISLSIYLLSANYRKIDFYRRLKNRAINTAKILVEIEEVNAELLQRLERNNPASLSSQYIVIYNYKNEILYQSDSNAPISIDTTLLNKIRIDKEIEFSKGDYEALGFLFTEQYDRYTVVGAAIDVYGSDALDNLRNTLIATFFISIFLVSLIGWFYAGRVLKPISKIVDEVGAITEENLSRRLAVYKENDELGKLATTFNKMLQRLQNAFASQKTFIANASHEIKTPITVMAGEIEVTLLHDRDKEYYIKILRSVHQGLRGLNRLSTQLLILAQTSSDNPQRNLYNLRIDDIVWEAKEELQRFHPEYVIDIQFMAELNHDALSVNGDPQLLKIALMNLIDNGCKYSDNKTVEVKLLTKPEFIQMDFLNTGPGIETEMIEKIFNPFFRATSADKRIKGFGIGLSLADRIVHLHGGQISVDSKPHHQTKFTVLLPITAKDSGLISI